MNRSKIDVHHCTAIRLLLQVARVAYIPIPQSSAKIYMKGTGSKERKIAATLMIIRSAKVDPALTQRQG